MIKKTKSDKLPRPTEPVTLESLYYEFLDLFYGNGDRRSARKLVKPLEDLANSPKYTDSIRAEEVRSLLAEFRGDLTEAVRCREAEIRKIYELHGMSINTPSWGFVKKLYDFRDIGDRLDLLALLYDRLGDLERAIATLHESKSYCEAHGVPFDGQDILDELTGGDEAEASDQPSKRTASRKRLGRRNGASVAARDVKQQSSARGKRKRTPAMRRSAPRTSRGG